MRYDYEFKQHCVDLYRKGRWPETPDGVKAKTFRSKIRDWVRLEDLFGSEILKHNNSNKKWTPEQRYELVAQVLAGKSIKGIALLNGINDGQLFQWVSKYKTLGYNGLIDKKRSRSSKEPSIKMKSQINPTPLTESEREELIRLRAEIEYIRAENEVIKKEIALREEKAAQLKAKKQRSSKNSGNKDSN